MEKEQGSFTTEQERPATRDPVVPWCVPDGSGGSGGRMRSEAPNSR
jgi:hypothetical protein